MTPLEATLIAIAVLVTSATLILRRNASRPEPGLHHDVPAAPCSPLSPADVQAIELALGVALPADFASFLQAPRAGPIDNTTVVDDPELIIGFTQDYRASSGWPAHLVWFGDEADGCPYTLDCLSGEVFRLQKGNLAKAWDRHPSFSAFVAKASDVPA